MIEVLNTIGVMKQIHHDNEGSSSSTEFIRLFSKHNIKQIITTSPPPFAERMVQTLKQMIHTRLEGLDMTEERWIDMLKPVLKKSITQRSTRPRVEAQMMLRGKTITLTCGLTLETKQPLQEKTLF